jgi:hypothetical protein
VWTVSVSKTERNGLVLAVLTFTSGTRTVVQSYEIQNIVDNDYLAGQAKLKIAALDAMDTQAATIVEGSLQLKDPPSPSLGEQYRQNFVTWRKMQALIALGVMAADDPAFVALEKTVKDDFLPAYLPLLTLTSGL